jgi:hypothetical protein
LYSWTTLSYGSISQASFAPFSNHRAIFIALADFLVVARKRNALDR